MLARIICVSLLLTMTSCLYVMKPTKPAVPPKKSSVYEEVDLEGMIRRYIAKTHGDEPSIEGIYTVSGEVIRKGKSLLSSVERERTIERKDNYARVAILKDWPGSNTEYVEISLEEKNAPRYPIVAELNELAEGGGFIYKHYEPKGKVLTFTFLYDKNKPDILDGVYTETKNDVVITYKLTYVKVYPKNNNYR
jgi:hypothetical protein